MKQVFKFDIDGFYLCPVIIDDNEPIPSDCTNIKPPNGLYKGQFKNNIWVEAEDQSVLNTLKSEILEQIRVAKQKELEDSCSADLTYGYQYIVSGVQYRFSFDLEAQANFQGALRLLESGVVPFVPWTAYDPTGKRVRLNLTVNDLHGMELAQFHHKNDVTSKYNDLLLNHLYVADTEDEIKAISWGDMI